MKHTPGPWAYSRWDQFGDARFYVFQAEGAPYTPNYSDIATLIAETVSGERVQIQEANARLIAKSPELYDLIKYVLEKGTCYSSAIERSKGDCDFEEWGEKAKELIKQIEGEKE
jgi:hypothetical protein